MIHYYIQPASPEAHLFHITLRVAEPDAEGQRLTLPAWIPGSYMIRDFAKNIVMLKASSHGKQVDTKKLDKQSWQCAPCSGELLIEYQVYAWDLSVRSAHLDTTHGYFNGTSVFLRVVGQEGKRCQVEIQPPEGAQFADWQVATTLPSAGAAPFAFGHYQADGYEALIDHPVEMGRFLHDGFEVATVPHELILTGRHQADTQRLCTDLKPICEHHAAFFGGLPEMEKYQFQILVVGEGYGGLEHSSSCSLICRRDDLPRRGEKQITEGYRQLLALCSHEYFHLWHVKRIRPQQLKQADLSQEAYTSLLWVFEGITSYYDELALVRSGLIEVDSYLELLAQTITRVMRCSGRHKQTLTDASFDAWTKFYKQDENAPNAIISYYTKGALVALALDLTIRQQTRGKKSLDDLMRALWENYGKPDVGVPEDGIEQLAEQVTGLDLKVFFDRALRGTDDLPLKELLATVGIGYQMEAATSATDRGGLYVEEKTPEEQKPRPVLGARIASAEGGRAKLTVVLDNGAAQRAGLSAGDIVIAVDGIRATANNIEQLIAQIPQGSSIPLHLFRRDELMQFDVMPLPAPVDTCRLRVLDQATEHQIESRQSWLQLAAENT
ncbi:MAG: PDZ domain-containing protein [Candidatus Polarisedimenticolaceae bacterium]|nr:PDZ domain-containing protein [Candidatus Polarisedimenticolaceae bacterium]